MTDLLLIDAAIIAALVLALGALVAYAERNPRRVTDRPFDWERDG